jgi:hypothetical protein
VNPNEPQFPISHVKVHPNLDEQPSGYERNRLYSMKHGRSKTDASGWTDKQRLSHARDEENAAAETNGGQIKFDDTK